MKPTMVVMGALLISGLGTGCDKSKSDDGDLSKKLLGSHRADYQAVSFLYAPGPLEKPVTMPDGKQGTELANPILDLNRTMSEDFVITDEGSSYKLTFDKTCWVKLGKTPKKQMVWLWSWPLLEGSSCATSLGPATITEGELSNVQGAFLLDVKGKLADGKTAQWTLQEKDAPAKGAGK